MTPPIFSPQNHPNPTRGRGVTLPHVKTRPSDERSPDNAPLRSDSYQNGYTCKPKTRPQKNTRGKLNPDDPRPAPFTRGTKNQKIAIRGHNYNRTGVLGGLRSTYRADSAIMNSRVKKCKGFESPARAHGIRGTACSSRYEGS